MHVPDGLICAADVTKPSQARFPAAAHLQSMTGARFSILASRCIFARGAVLNDVLDR